jgi:Copine
MGAVASVLAPFDHDQKIQLYGFGASPKAKQPVSHCFPLNGNLADASVDGIDGLNQQYLESVKTVDFSGPTHAAPVILKVMADAKTRASAVSGPLNFTVLLLLTDGDLDDMPATLKACSDAADLPMSVMFVGIGKSEFKLMEPLRNGHKSANFLRMEDYGAGAAARLRAKVLADLPGQVESYFVGKGIAAKR